MSTPKRPTVLLISYLFPPAGGIPVQRALSLARYLPAMGFEVHVLAATNAAAPVMDASLLARIPSSVRVHHAFTPEPPFALRQKVWGWLSRKNRQPADSPPSGPLPAPARRSWKSLVTGSVRRILSPEPEVLWVPFATLKARRIIRRHGIRAVMITAPPFSAFLIGIRLKNEFPHLRVVSDFRDSWLLYYASVYDLLKDPRVRKHAEEIERTTVMLSDRVVAVSQSTRQELRTRYPDQPEEKFVCIPNGFDPEVFAGLPQHSPQPHAGKIVVAWVGTVATSSSPRYFLDALDSMPEPVRSAFELRFIGRVIPSEQGFLESRAFSIKQLGFLPQSVALQELAQADYALVSMTDGPSIPGKLYEYLATGKPILAVGPLHGELARTLEETRAGWCADPQDRQGLCRMIQTAYEAARAGGRPLEPDRAAIRRYERPQLVAEYAALLDPQPQPSPAEVAS